MAFLFANTRSMSLSDALANIGELKGVIANTLKQSGFTDVINNPSEVAGNKNGVRLSVLHLHIAGRQFWQVFMAGGDTAATQQTLNDVVNKVEHLAFL
ncbi:hypothetical protein UP10_09520 [Bradyrhizobium sp. LTSPM299]|uniref:hypothetical protein n=1 Tax=Bradyrhizobium sp. LTSPM299 TaxID=1619233 RepID=UPI0005C94402|nr:hypothetical protein [Bradyrhizobium sp. LTSPM299]KJC61120.1 hypothetical protein UP10_09520 [Bradyrhizobium sp. LTSPM299]